MTALSPPMVQRLALFVRLGGTGVGTAWGRGTRTPAHLAQRGRLPQPKVPPTPALAPLVAQASGPVKAPQPAVRAGLARTATHPAAASLVQLGSTAAAARTHARSVPTGGTAPQLEARWKRTALPVLLDATDWGLGSRHLQLAAAPAQMAPGLLQVLLAATTAHQGSTRQARAASHAAKARTKMSPRRSCARIALLAATTPFWGEVHWMPATGAQLAGSRARRLNRTYAALDGRSALIASLGGIVRWMKAVIASRAGMASTRAAPEPQSARLALWGATMRRPRELHSLSARSVRLGSTQVQFAAARAAPVTLVCLPVSLACQLAHFVPLDCMRAVVGWRLVRSAQRASSWTAWAPPRALRVPLGGTRTGLAARCARLAQLVGTETLGSQHMLVLHSAMHVLQVVSRLEKACTSLAQRARQASTRQTGVRLAVTRATGAHTRPAQEHHCARFARPVGTKTAPPVL